MRKYVITSVAGILAVLFALFGADRYLLARYAALESPTIVDRNGVLLSQFPNEKGQYVRYVDRFPQRALELLVRKEDRFFYVHFGLNPISTARALLRRLSEGRAGGASTITQQLVKNLLGNEQDRTLANKILEMFGAVALEMFRSKETILSMYANTVYMGNQVQGLNDASALYFGKDLNELDDTKLTMLLATISSPSVLNPWREENMRASRNLANRLQVIFDPSSAVITDEHAYAPVRNFELESMSIRCERSCTTTLDDDLVRRMREILRAHVNRSWESGARSGAIVAIKLPENEVLAIVGTPDVHGAEEGQQINMALQPRPIGSTAKPFIYLQGFAKGLRPYTLVNDREYKYPIGSGFPLYPKNYDGSYRGWVTLHSALSNSLNVPTVKTLEYVGLPEFYGFLQHGLGFRPQRDLDEYQYGIALGALDMDPLTLAQFLTIFPNTGTLSPLRFFDTSTSSPFLRTPMSDVRSAKKVAHEGDVQLVTKILQDRLTGVQQFGLSSSLNLPQGNYAVKTGTSQNYHDSWTVGYTPDFLVVVWFGDPDNKPLRHITGQSGAGAVWHDVMELLMQTEHNKKTTFDLSLVRDVPIKGSIDFALLDDVIEEHQNLLKDDAIILSPQDGDTFLIEVRTVIPLLASQEAQWHVDGEYYSSGERVMYTPTIGDHKIKATDTDGATHEILIHVIDRP